MDRYPGSFRTPLELEKLWKPFLVPGHPVNISFEAPMFLQMGNNTQLFRDTSVNRLAAAASSPEVTAVSKGSECRSLNLAITMRRFRK